MALTFPNPSRSFDATRDAVRFWGYDSAIEASFYVSEGALARMQPGIRPDESGFLDAFDVHREDRPVVRRARTEHIHGSPPEPDGDRQCSDNPRDAPQRSPSRFDRNEDHLPVRCSVSMPRIPRPG